MDQNRPTLLLTRPAAASARFAAAFRARFGADWPLVISPLMRTEWLAPATPQTRARDVVFTSETAVHGFARLTDRRDLHAWCVGARTAGAAGRAGFAATAGPGDAAGLAGMIAQALPGGRVLWPRGRNVAQDMADLLVPAGIETVSLIVYAQAELPPTAPALDLLRRGDPVLLPLFSARSAALVLAGCPDRNAPLWIAAISQGVADRTNALTPEKLAVAARPDSDGMIGALAALLSAARG